MSACALSAKVATWSSPVSRIDERRGWWPGAGGGGARARECACVRALARAPRARERISGDESTSRLLIQESMSGGDACARRTLRPPDSVHAQPTAGAAVGGSLIGCATFTAACAAGAFGLGARDGSLFSLSSNERRRAPLPDTSSRSAPSSSSLSLRRLTTSGTASA
jgi:hypothetical protein